MPNLDTIADEIGKRFREELERHELKPKPLSSEIGASPNTLGGYLRTKVPYQWAYLHQLHRHGVDIRYVLLGHAPATAGLSSDEMLLLKAFRTLNASERQDLLKLSISFAKAVERQKKLYRDTEDLIE